MTDETNTHARKGGIERRIVTSILTVGILPMTVAAIAGYFTARGAQSLSVRQTLSVSAQQTAEGLELALESRFRHPRSLAQDPNVLAFVKGETQDVEAVDALRDQLLRVGQSAVDSFSIFGLYDSDGDLLLSSHPDRAKPSLRSEWIEDTRETRFVQFEYMPESRYVGVIVAPVFDGSDPKPVGWVCEILGINQLFAFALGHDEGMKEQNEGSVRYQVAFMLESAGAKGVTYLDSAATGDAPTLVIGPMNPRLSERLEAGRRADSLALDGYEVEGKEQQVFLAYHKLDVLDHLYLLTYQPASEVFFNINMLAVMAVLGCIVFIAFLCLNAYRNVHNNIVRPLALLNEGAQIIRQGDLDLKLKIDTGDEIEEVAQSFNKMALALSRNIGQLEDSEEKYRTLVTSMREGIYQTDPDGVITFINPIGAQTFGFKQAHDAIGRSIRDFFLEEEDFDILSRELELKGFFERSRLWMRCVDGRTICVEISGSRVIDDRGISRGTEAIYRDVTQNVQLEQEARERSERMSAINQIANVINSSLEAGRLYESLAAELRKLVNFDYAAVALLETQENRYEARQLWPENEVEPGFTYTLSGDSSCSAWVAREQRCLVVNDCSEENWNFSGQFPPEAVSCLCVPLYATGRIIGTLNLSANTKGAFSRHDVDVLEEMAPHVAVAIRNAKLLVNLQLSLEEVTRAHEKLADVNQELTTLDEMKTNLLSNVSHELRTPLVSVMGYTDMINSGKVGPISNVQREYLEISLRNIEKLVTLIENLLDFSRLHRGDEKLRFDRFDLVECAQSSIQLIRPVADSRNIAVKLMAPDEPVEVDGDKGKLGQVFNNLLSNAVKFNADGGEVAVEIRKHADEAEVVVRDTGIGIPQEALDKIFTRFYQYDSSSTRKYGGTGIGLSIALDIVRMHGSLISVNSEPGKGSTFRFSLPLKAKHREIAAPDELVPEPQTTHLLLEVVTRDRTLSSDVRTVLAEEGMDVIHAADSENALSLARKYHPDCVLLDAEENGMVGGLLEEFEADAEMAGVPVILLLSDDDVYAKYRHRVSARIKRGFRKSTLMGTIQHALAQSTGDTKPPGEGILCVDDDPEILTFMSRCLEGEGYQVDTCSSGSEALERLGEGGYGLVLLDIAMPGTDGWQICRQLKSRDDLNGTLVYMVTAKPIEQNRTRLQEVGADGYLMKPFRPEDLIHLVEGMGIPKRSASA